MPTDTTGRTLRLQHAATLIFVENHLSTVIESMRGAEIRRAVTLPDVAPLLRAREEVQQVIAALVAPEPSAPVLAAIPTNDGPPRPGPGPVYGLPEVKRPEHM